jgi:hypothetical protein
MEDASAGMEGGELEVEDDVDVVHPGHPVGARKRAKRMEREVVEAAEAVEPAPSAAEDVEVLGQGMYGVVTAEAGDPSRARKTCWARPSTCREIAVLSYLARVGLEGRVSPKCWGSVTNFSAGDLSIVMDRGVLIVPEKLDDALRTRYAREILALYILWSGVGLYHFDLKLDNFLVVRDAVRVIDWGLARTDGHKLYALDKDFVNSEQHRHPELYIFDKRPWMPEHYDKYELWALAYTLDQLTIQGGVQGGKCVGPLAPDVEAVVQGIFGHTIRTREELLRSVGAPVLSVLAEAGMGTGIRGVPVSAVNPVFPLAGEPDAAVHRCAWPAVVRWLFQQANRMNALHCFGGAVVVLSYWLRWRMSGAQSASQLQMAAVCALYMTRCIADFSDDSVAATYVDLGYGWDWTRKEVLDMAQEMFAVFPCQDHMTWLEAVNMNPLTLAGAHTNMFGFSPEVLLFAAAVFRDEAIALSQLDTAQVAWSSYTYEDLLLKCVRVLNSTLQGMALPPESLAPGGTRANLMILWNTRVGGLWQCRQH